jgi:hypothetical protein
MAEKGTHSISPIKLEWVNFWKYILRNDLDCNLEYHKRSKEMICKGYFFLSETNFRRELQVTVYLSAENDI